MRRTGFVLFALAALSLTGRAQQPLSQPQATFRAGVDLVEVDVSVLDKDRRPVRGLAEREPSPARAAWVRDVPPDVTTNDVRPEGRLVVIMLDWSIRFADHLLA